MTTPTFYSRYLLKPSVMCMDRGFNPFVQKKIDDTVPARLSVKIISGMFITSKKTELMVEIEMYGLPADIVRRRFTKKRAPAPHPFWDEDYFVFKRVRGKGEGNNKAANRLRQLHYLMQHTVHAHLVLSQSFY